MKTIQNKYEHNKMVLPTVRNIIVIASGKGGVGKSTIASNLSIAIARTGALTALVDADFYGPAIPQMFNARHSKIKDLNYSGKPGKNPVVKYGVKLFSFGFMMENEKTLLWDGKIVAQQFLKQICETNWGEIDYMIIDLPPNAGDITQAVVKKLHVAGAILITTPQSIALTEVEKVAAVFADTSVNVPILGVIENMSYLVTSETPPGKSYLFGKDGGDILAKEFHVPLLAKIPISKEICESGEIGDPPAHHKFSLFSEIFDSIAHKIVEEIPSFHEFYY